MKYIITIRLLSCHSVFVYNGNFFVNVEACLTLDNVLHNIWYLLFAELFIHNHILLLPFMCTVGFLPREAMLSTVYAAVVCLCVCHTPVLYQNG